MAEAAADTQALNRLYDERLFNSLVDEYYGGSRFLNFGYWDEGVETPAQASQRLLARLADLVPARSGRILDVACGAGASSRFLLGLAPPRQVLGINIAARQLAACRQLAPGALFLAMDAARLGFAGESFDAILCVEAAFHFRTREGFLKEAHRVLREGGVLVLSDALISAAGRPARPHFPPENFVEDLDQYREVFRRAGFGEILLEDATARSWQASYWQVVRFAYGKLLAGLVSADQLYAFLDRIYRLTADLRHYVLVRAVKGGGPPQP
ncbi:MAG: methyltransferase domain-containing protein [Thermodesulfobacteriota bacterium]